MSMMDGMQTIQYNSGMKNKSLVPRQLTTVISHFLLILYIVNFNFSLCLASKHLLMRKISQTEGGVVMISNPVKVMAATL